MSEESIEPVAASEPEVQVPYPLRSKEWYNHVLCTKLQYESLKFWQLDLTIVLCDGGDVICIIATGAGKSALIHGTVVAHLAAGKHMVGIVIVPTKGLADDQARAATAKGIKALAIHRDSLRAARSESTPRDLFAEIKAGHWSLVFVGPEMLNSKPFRKLLDDPEFLVQLELVVIDECHLSEEWKGFRTTYQRIRHLRDSLPSRVAWLAISATVAPTEFDVISTGLGFMPGKYTLLRQPVDRPTIKYIPLFLQHPVSGLSMLDFAWIIPYDMQSIDEIPITIIFVNTIGFGKKLRTYLTSLLPRTFTGEARQNLIRGYHGMSKQESRRRSIKALRAGTQTRILMCTDTGAFGIDIREVTRVVIAEMSKTFKTQTQRVGRIREEGDAYIYYPPSINLVDQSKEAIKSRSRVEKIMVDFANGSLECCPRHAACLHWGEPFVQPRKCCIIHNPDEQKRELEVKRRVDEAKRAATRNRRSLVGPRAHPNQSRRPLDKRVMVPPVMNMLKEWRLLTWPTVPGRKPQEPPERFISDKLLEHLCNRMHVCVTLSNFWQVMQSWDRLNEWGRELYKVVVVTLESAESMWSSVDELNQSRKGAQSSLGAQKPAPKAQETTGFGSGEVRAAIKLEDPAIVFEGTQSTCQGVLLNGECFWSGELRPECIETETKAFSQLKEITPPVKPL